MLFSYAHSVTIHYYAYHHGIGFGTSAALVEVTEFHVRSLL